MAVTQRRPVLKEKKNSDLCGRAQLIVGGGTPENVALGFIQKQASNLEEQASKQNSSVASASVPTCGFLP